VAASFLFRHIVSIQRHHEASKKLEGPPSRATTSSRVKRNQSQLPAAQEKKAILFVKLRASWRLRGDAA
jgi:hypothetical protein